MIAEGKRGLIMDEEMEGYMRHDSALSIERK